jgi:hypothetical protein
MSINTGSRLGTYEILSALGAGGPPALAHERCELRRGLAVAQREVTS